MIVPVDLFIFFHPFGQVSVNLQNIPNKEMNIKELEQVNGGNDNRQIDMPCVPNPRPIYPFDPVRCAIKHN